MTLGSEISSEIFKHLREDEIETFTFEIARLDSGGFGRTGRGPHGVPGTHDGPGFYHHRRNRLCKGTFREILGFAEGGGYHQPAYQFASGTAFRFIRRTDPTHLLNFIQQEHPQTIALILAYLEPQKASVILGSLPHEVQSDVAKRIATMDRTSPEVLREVERVLEKKLSTLSSEDYTAAGGVESIVDILNLVDRSTEKGIIESLEEEDPELSGRYQEADVRI